MVTGIHHKVRNLYPKEEAPAEETSDVEEAPTEEPAEEEAEMLLPAEPVMDSLPLPEGPVEEPFVDMGFF